MTEPSPSALLTAIRAIALEAGALILRYYAEGFESRLKADGSPVTQADQAAEALILPALARLLPGVPTVAEEAAAAGVVPDVSGGRFWLVDPLDGTKEFLNRNGEFTVNIALVEAGRPVLGVVLAPALGDLYAGAEGLGAIRSRPGEADRVIAARSAPDTGWTAVGSRSHADTVAESRFLADFPVTTRQTRGSSLKFCLVAEGEADLYPRFGTTHEWDTAAGHAVLAAAGGRVEVIGNGVLGYGKPGFLNPPFVARGQR